MCVKNERLMATIINERRKLHRYRLMNDMLNEQATKSRNQMVDECKRSFWMFTQDNEIETEDLALMLIRRIEYE